jgi:hypothetical protein
MFVSKDVVIIGRMRVISTSKIKKITVIRKNWRENGTRAEHIGSNPHSNGEGFSRSLNSFLANIKFKIIKIIEIVADIRNKINI